MQELSPAAYRLPSIPPRGVELPKVGAVIGPDPSHFIVEEIPAYPLSDSGEHVFFWIEKIGLNTADVAKRLAQQTGVPQRDIGYAGMKDRNAITRQWMSALYKGEGAGQLDLGEGARILKTTKHNNKLRTGHLIGNRFTITLVGASEDDGALAQAITEALRKSGLRNYYGAQRFGHRGKNLEAALTWLEGEVQKETPSQEPTPRLGRRKGKKSGRFDNKLHPSVIQSEFFNRYLSARLALNAPLLRGEAVRLKGTGTHFVVEDVDKELPRFQTGDLILSGAMPGGKTLQSQHEAAELESTIWKDMNIDEQQVQALNKSAPGARRDLSIELDGLRCTYEEGKLVLEFALPAGGYATQVIREYNEADWMNPRAPK